jgi:hypothetical protein
MLQWYLSIYHGLSSLTSRNGLSLLTALTWDFGRFWNRSIHLVHGRRLDSFLQGEDRSKDLSHLIPADRSKARTVFARSNTAIVGSNPTEAWMFVCVLCAFFLCLYIVSSETASRPNKKRLMRTYHWISPLHVIWTVSKLAYRIWVILIANERVKKKI